MHRYRKRWNDFWDEFETFSHQTAIKPLSFIHHSKFKVETIMWSIVIVFFTGLTVWNVCESVEHYRKRETLTKIRIMESGEIDYGTPALCVEYDLPKHFANLNQNEQTVVMQQVTAIPNLLDYLISAASHMDRKCDEGAEFAPLRTTDDASWCFADVADQIQPSFSNKLLVLMEVGSCILFSASGFESFENGYEVFYSHKGRKASVVVNKTVTRMIERHGGGLLPELATVASRLVEDSSERLHELNQAIGSLLCHKMAILTGYVPPGHSFSYKVARSCEMINILWVGITPFDRMSETVMPSDAVSRLCVTVPFQNMLSFKALEAKTAHVFVNPISNANLVYLDLAGDIVKSAQSGDRLKLVAGTKTSALISTLGHYRPYRDPYQIEKWTLGMGDCTVRCMIKHIVTKCNCWPSTVSTVFQTPEETNMTTCFIFPVCLEINNQSTRFGERIKSCQKETCQKVREFRSFQLETTIEPFGDYPNCTFLTMSPQNYIYPVFEEVLAMDVRAFLSALGGSLSIYIGASFIAIIHIIVYILRSAYSCMATGCVKKPTKKELSDQRQLQKIVELFSTVEGLKAFKRLSRTIDRNPPFRVVWDRQNK